MIVDQEVCRCAKIRISLRIAGVGAQRSARSMACAWRAAVRRLRSRWIMLMVVLTSRTCGGVWFVSTLIGSIREELTIYGVSLLTGLRIEGWETPLPKTSM
jgi:hypothetical protein